MSAPKPEPWLIMSYGPVGNAASFWRPKGQGYTCDVDEAGHYSRKEALRQERDRPHIDVAVPLSAVLEHTMRTADWGKLKAHAQRRKDGEQ